jgi:hypothetical protein
MVPKNLFMEMKAGINRTNTSPILFFRSAAAAQVRAQVRPCGICGGLSATGVGFLRVLRFPLPIIIPPTASLSLSIVQGWCSRPVSGRCTKWTQSHPTQSNLKNIYIILSFIKRWTFGVNKIRDSVHY